MAVNNVRLNLFSGFKNTFRATVLRAGLALGTMVMGTVALGSMGGCQRAEQLQFDTTAMPYGSRTLDYQAIMQQTTDFDFTSLTDPIITDLYPHAPKLLTEANLETFKNIIQTNINPTIDIDTLKEFAIGHISDPRPFTINREAMDKGFQTLILEQNKGTEEALEEATQAKTTAEETATEAITARDEAKAKAIKAEQEAATAKEAQKTAQAKANELTAKLATAPKEQVAPATPDAGIFYVNLKPNRSAEVIIDLPDTISIDAFEDVIVTVEGADLKLDPSLSDLKAKRLFYTVTAQKDVTAGRVPILISYKNKDNDDALVTLSSLDAFKNGLQFTVPEIVERPRIRANAADVVSGPKLPACKNFAPYLQKAKKSAGECQ